MKIGRFESLRRIEIERIDLVGIRKGWKMEEERKSRRESIFEVKKKKKNREKERKRKDDWNGKENKEKEKKKIWKDEKKRELKLVEKENW